MAHLLEVKGLTTTFAGDYGKNISVDHIDFHVDEGEVVCIVGESGCGKSVTSLSIMGLLGRGGQVTEGEVLFEGKNLLSMTEKELDEVRGDHLTMIFQDPLTSLNPVFTIGSQIVESIRTHMHLSKEEARKRASKLLEKVGMPDPEQTMKKYPHTLSGGMRQRVMIAMALACRPKILIADEPTTALDVTIQAQILHLMNDLQSENGTSIIFITHDLGVINEMADDVVVMYCGQVVEKTSARVIFTDCEYSHPYTEGLMMSIPRMDNVGSKLEPIPGNVPHPLALPKGCKFAPRCKYCTQKCIDEEPELRENVDGQFIRCFYPNKEERKSAEHQEIVVNH